MNPFPPVRPSVAVASLYQTYLVTRHTGRAVRLTIERMVDERPGPSLTVIDFREVAVIDFSCADEVVARLLYDALSRSDAAAPHYFLLDGLEEEHMDPLASALARRGLAMAARTSMLRPVLLGAAEPEARRVWEALAHRGRARPSELSGCVDGNAETCRKWLARLDSRRLVRDAGDQFESLFAILGDGGLGAGEAPA